MELLELAVQMFQFGLAGVALFALSFALRMAHETIRLHITLSYDAQRSIARQGEFSGERSGSSQDENSPLSGETTTNN